MEEAYESRKRKHPYRENYENAPQILPFSDELDGGDAELEIEEEMVIAVMKRLEEEISSASASTPSRFLNPNGGSEESCGSSFSDSASTVMASALHTCALPGAMTCHVCGPWPWAVGSGEVAAAAGPSGSETEEEEEADEWLARVLGGPGFELEECFL